MPYTEWEPRHDLPSGIDYRERWPVGTPKGVPLRVITEEWAVPDDGPPARTVVAVEVWPGTPGAYRIDGT